MSQQELQKGGPDPLTVIMVLSVVTMLASAFYRDEIREIIDVLAPFAKYIILTLIVLGVSVWWSLQATTAENAHARASFTMNMVGFCVLIVIALVTLAFTKAKIGELFDGFIR